MPIDRSPKPTPLCATNRTGRGPQVNALDLRRFDKLSMTSGMTTSLKGRSRLFASAIRRRSASAVPQDPKLVLRFSGILDDRKSLGLYEPHPSLVIATPLARPRGQASYKPKLNQSDRPGIHPAAPGGRQSDVCRPILITCAQSESPIESAYPRQRDRRLSRKTRAAVGKPPGDHFGTRCQQC